MRIALLVSLLAVVAVHAADPANAVYWSASQSKAAWKTLPPKVNPERHLATERLMDSAFTLYRDGNSEAEIHDEQADFIVFHEGTGVVIVGGKMVDGKRSGPGEQRGKAIEGGTRYEVAAGDMLYVPANTVHQFVVEPGKHFVATIVKVTPKK